MMRQGWGRIVNTGSMHALVASPYKSAYNAAKHGVAGFSKTLALEVATKGITVNAVCPGYVLTELIEKQLVSLRFLVLGCKRSLDFVLFSFSETSALFPPSTFRIIKQRPVVYPKSASFRIFCWQINRSNVLLNLRKLVPWSDTCAPMKRQPSRGRACPSTVAGRRGDCSEKYNDESDYRA
jgi:short-subunit dehydrogenase